MSGEGNMMFNKVKIITKTANVAPKHSCNDMSYLKNFHNFHKIHFSSKSWYFKNILKIILIIQKTCLKWCFKGKKYFHFLLGQWHQHRNLSTNRNYRKWSWRINGSGPWRSRTSRRDGRQTTRSPSSQSACIRAS